MCRVSLPSQGFFGCYFSLVVDGCLLLFLSSSILGAPLISLLLIDAVLLFSAALGTAVRSPSILLPNLICRALLMFVLIFLACFALDALVRTDDRNQSRWRRSFSDDSTLLIFILIFVALIMIEVKIFFSFWYKINFESVSNAQDEAEKVSPPPSYTQCVRPNDLPSYAEAANRIDEDVMRL